MDRSAGGKLDWIGKLLVGSLELLHKVFRNYGIAIIALTLLINLCLFPRTLCHRPLIFLLLRLA